jgi:hypothetical protein
VVVTPPTTGVSGLPLPFVEGFGIVVVVL